MKVAGYGLAVPLSALVILVSTPSRAIPFPGDEAFARMEYDTALLQYDSVLQVNAPYPELSWRMARLHIAMGDVAEGNARSVHYRSAEEHARHCVTLDSVNSQGYAWLAAALGNIAMNAGSRRKVELANEIKRCLDRAIVLDSTNDVAWSILGTFYRSLGGVSWIERQLAHLLLGSLPDGGYGEAEQAFRRAIALAPRTVRHRFELALFYEQTGRLDEAGVEYTQCTLLTQQMASDRERIEVAIKWLHENRERAHSMR